MVMWWSAVAMAKGVALPCPEVGDEATYRILRESKRTPNGQSELQSQGAFRYTYTYRVDRVDGTVLDVTLTSGAGEVVVPHPDPLMAEVLGGLTDADLPPMPVRIDTANRMLAYVDPQPVIDLQLRVLDAMLPKLAERFPDSPPEVGEQLRQMFTSPEMAQRSLLESGLPLAQFMCSALEIGEFTYQSQVPNPMGGPALDTDGKLTIAAKGKRVHIEIHERPTEASMKAATLAMVERMGLPVEQMEAALAEMRLETSTALSLDATTKDPWPTWTSSRTISVGGVVGREDTWVVERAD
jgi:hypothetical protein